jgi:hypothetical protein
LSTENVKLMHSGPHFVSPKVDQQWILHFPEHQTYLGDKLIHHHIEHGNLTTALPKKLHETQPARSYFHTNLGVIKSDTYHRRASKISFQKS